MSNLTITELQDRIRQLQGDVWLDAIDYAKSRGADLSMLLVMEQRRELGIERYGTPLQYGNGRDAVLDLREELLDAYAYATQAGLASVRDALLDLIP